MGEPLGSLEHESLRTLNRLRELGVADCVGGLGWDNRASKQKLLTSKMNYRRLKRRNLRIRQKMLPAINGGR